MGEIFVPVNIDRATESRYGGTIHSESIGRMMVAEVKATGQHIRHTTSHIRSAQEEYFQLLAPKSTAGSTPPAADRPRP